MSFPHLITDLPKTRTQPLPTASPTQGVTICFNAAQAALSYGCAMQRGPVPTPWDGICNAPINQGSRDEQLLNQGPRAHLHHPLLYTFIITSTHSFLRSIICGCSKTKPMFLQRNRSHDIILDRASKARMCHEMVKPVVGRLREKLNSMKTANMTLRKSCV